MPLLAIFLHAVRSRASGLSGRRQREFLAWPLALLLSIIGWYLRAFFQTPRNGGQERRSEIPKCDVGAPKRCLCISVVSFLFSSVKRVCSVSFLILSIEPSEVGTHRRQLSCRSQNQKIDASIQHFERFILEPLDQLFVVLFVRAFSHRSAV